MADIDRLSRLPLELLVEVSRHLMTVDYGHLRRTCSSINEALFHHFAIEFFSTRQICIYPPSLESLYQISAHAKLAKYVKKIIFGLDNVLIWNVLGGDPTAGPAAKLLANQLEILLSTGSWKVELSTAFGSMTSLKELEIKDFISRKRRPSRANSLEELWCPQLRKGRWICCHALLGTNTYDDDGRCS